MKIRANKLLNGKQYAVLDEKTNILFVSEAVYTLLKDPEVTEIVFDQLRCIYLRDYLTTLEEEIFSVVERKTND